MKNIIFLSFLSPWSMGDKKGAPSFYKTIMGYTHDWNVCLITQSDSKDEKINIDGIHSVTYKSPFIPMLFIKKISFFGRIINSIYGTYRLYILGKKYINKYGRNTVIYAYEVHAVKAGKILSTKFGLPLITRFQGTVLYPIENTQINRLKKFPHFQALETAANVIIMTDDGTFGDKTLKRLDNTSSKIYFWKNGVDIGRNYTRNSKQIADFKRKFLISDDDKILLTVSRLVSWKRIDRAVETLKNLIDEGHEYIKLLIVGDGEEKQNLVNMVEKYNLKNNVIFTGAVKQEEVSLCMDISDVFLSLYDLSNVGNPLLEAMNMGKPIITLNTGNTASIIKNNENGILLDIDKFDQVSENVLKLLQDRNFSKLIGDKAKQYAQEHLCTWEERINKEVEIVNDLLKK